MQTVWNEWKRKRWSRKYYPNHYYWITCNKLSFFFNGKIQWKRNLSQLNFIKEFVWFAEIKRYLNRYSFVLRFMGLFDRFFPLYIFIFFLVCSFASSFFFTDILFIFVLVKMLMRTVDCVFGVCRHWIAEQNHHGCRRRQIYCYMKFI